MVGLACIEYSGTCFQLPSTLDSDDGGWPSSSRSARPGWTLPLLFGNYSPEPLKVINRHDHPVACNTTVVVLPLTAPDPQLRAWT